MFLVDYYVFHEGRKTFIGMRNRKRLGQKGEGG
jgi:hypothetical protein